jgi:hypothetical protein
MSGAIPPLNFPISSYCLNRNNFSFSLIVLCKTSNACFVSLYFVMENTFFFSKRPSERNMATKLGGQQN